MKIKTILKKTILYVLYKKIFPYSLKEVIEFNHLYKNAFKIVKNYKYQNSKNINEDIIVSLTTYPARIKSAGIVIASIMNQTLLPKKIVLTLATSQFPNHKLPRLINKEIKEGLEIIWTDDDLRSHKKYYYVMKKYQDNIIITVDDDNLYDKNLIQTLFNSYQSFPNCISCILAHLIVLDNEKLDEYKKWNNNVPNNIPSNQYLAVGVGGILYPPKLLHLDLFNKSLITSLCPSADDIWLKFMELLHNPITKVVKTGTMVYNTIPTSQITNLFSKNIYEDLNDKQIGKLLEKYSIQEIIQKIKTS